MNHRPSTDGALADRRFESALYGAARSRRRRRLCEALALACLLAAVGLVGAAYCIDAFRFAPDAVRAARVVFYIVVAGALAGFVLPVLLEPYDRRRTAARLEARDARLDALLLSASDAIAGRRAGDESEGLKARLWSEAAAAVEGDEAYFNEERRRSRRAAGGALGAAALALALLAAGPPGMRQAAGLLRWPAADPAAASPYEITVTPGDARLRSGSDQRIRATPVGFRPAELTLYQRVLPGGELHDEWQHTTMRREGDRAALHGDLLDVRDSFEYYVAGEGVESARYRIEVVPPPEVTRIDLVYRYPPRTGRAPEHVVGQGDIRAVERTSVDVTITPSVPVDRGVIRLDDEREVALKAVGGLLTGTIDVESDGFYRVELPDFEGVLVRASREYRIDALVDTRPSVRIVAPGADIDVTRIEEVDVELAARDDVALGEMALVVWINGGTEEVIRFPVQPGPDEVRESVRLFLEDRDVEPGDLVAYHARASDVAGEADREVTSDIYFMQVRPFDRRYTRAPGGGGGGGGGESGDGMLSAQQRQLVIALFRLRQLVREADTGDGVVAERIDTLSDAQARIRERVEAIVRRLGARRIPGIQETLDPMLAELPRAADAMVRVEALLAAADIERSLEAARAALRHLQRADAGYREIQVAMSRGGGDAAGDLTNLFRLEMDRFQSQYEHVQRGQWDAPERQLDEALRKLAELARRQQRELERSASRHADSGSAAQDELLARAEELLRELERLTRNRPDRQLADAMEAARDAARAMAEGGASGGRRQALDKLRQAERTLRRFLDRDMAGGIGEALRRAESLVERQGAIERGIESLDEEPTDPNRIGEVLRDKQELAVGARALDADIERLADDHGPAVGDRGTRPADEALPETLERARDALSPGTLEDLLAESRAGLRQADGAAIRELERRIRRSLEGARDALETAQDIAAGNAKGAGESADALRDLVRAQDRLQQSMRQRAREAPGTGAENGSGGSGASGAAIAGGPVDARGGNDDGVATGGFANSGSIGGRFDMADARRRLLDDARTLEVLRDALDPLGRQRGEIDSVVDAMRRLAESGANDQVLLRDHAALLSVLKDLERRTRDGADDERRGLIARDRPTPRDDYRELVEEYYRRLSERPRGVFGG